MEKMKKKTQDGYTFYTPKSNKSTAYKIGEVLGYVIALSLFILFILFVSCNPR